MPAAPQATLTFTSPVTPGGTRLLTLTGDGLDWGGVSWDVTWDDDGAGGSFDPTGGQLVDSGSPPLTTTYTAPLTPLSVNFQPTAGVNSSTPGTDDLEITIIPLLLVVAAASSVAARRQNLRLPVLPTHLEHLP